MEPIRDTVVVAIDEATQVAAARRAAHDLCARLDLPDDLIARAELVTVELARNILQHALTGQLLFAPDPRRDAIAIIAIDRGPGIASIARAMDDGYSSAGTPGLGLGALKRMSQRFEIYSTLGKGTVAAARVGPTASPNSLTYWKTDWEMSPWPASVLSVPLHGETANGDSWAIHTGPSRTVYFLADGLGHGQYASEASAMATRIFSQALERDPLHPLSELLTEMHTPMHATRGAAVAAFAVEHPAEKTEAAPANLKAFGCGVGNISCLMQAPDGTSRSMVSHNGTVGHQMRRVQEFSFSLAPGTLLFLHSDGLSTHWKLSQYPGLESLSPAVIAGVLFRDTARPRDDATILVSRLQYAAERVPNG